MSAKFNGEVHVRANRGTGATYFDVPWSKVHKNYVKPLLLSPYYATFER